MSALTARHPRLDAQWEYRLLFALTFPLFLGGALLRHADERRGPDGMRRVSLVQAAYRRAAAVLPFAFRG